MSSIFQQYIINILLTEYNFQMSRPIEEAITNKLTSELNVGVNLMNFTIITYCHSDII